PVRWHMSGREWAAGIGGGAELAFYFIPIRRSKLFAHRERNAAGAHSAPVAVEDMQLLLGDSVAVHLDKELPVVVGRSDQRNHDVELPRLAAFDGEGCLMSDGAFAAVIALADKLETPGALPSGLV